MKGHIGLVLLLGSAQIAPAQNSYGSAPVSASPVASNPDVGQTATPSQYFALPAMTLVEIEIVDALNSKTSHIGETFNIRLAAPIMIDGQIAVPKGTTGKGEVIHAAKARAAGKAGELIIAARYLDYQGMKLPLRSLKYGQDTAGQSHVGEAAAVGIVVAAPLVLFVTGGQVDIPAGMPATAKLASDVQVLTDQKLLQQEGNP
jgi:hypothetical protein